MMLLTSDPTYDELVHTFKCHQNSYLQRARSHSQCMDEIRRFFVEISKFSKHSLRLPDDQLGFGLTSSTDDRRRSRRVLCVGPTLT